VRDHDALGADDIHMGPAAYLTHGHSFDEPLPVDRKQYASREASELIACCASGASPPRWATPIYKSLKSMCIRWCLERSTERARS